MTELEWLAATDPEPMLAFLVGRQQGGVRHEYASERKLRLFAVAYCRTVWNLIFNDRNRRAIEVAERHAESEATDTELAAAESEATDAGFAAALSNSEKASRARVGLGFDVPEEMGTIAIPVTNTNAGVAASWLMHVMEGISPDGAPGRAALLRCVFGVLPFRKTYLNPTLVTWTNGTVQRMAQVAYDERHLPSGTLDPSRLALLADALEDAGCTDPELLAHLRSPLPHCRGCWAVDLVLGKA
jgi:hypothetical protein